MFCVTDNPRKTTFGWCEKAMWPICDGGDSLSQINLRLPQNLFPHQYNLDRQAQIVRTGQIGARQARNLIWINHYVHSKYVEIFILIETILLRRLKQFVSSQIASAYFISNEKLTEIYRNMYPIVPYSIRFHSPHGAARRGNGVVNLIAMCFAASEPFEP